MELNNIIEFCREYFEVGEMFLLLGCFLGFVYGAYTILEWGIHQINLAIVNRIRNIEPKEKMLTEMPSKYESMKAGLVLYNTLTDKYLSIERIWNGAEHEHVFTWADSTPSRVIDQNGCRNTGFSWNDMINSVGRQIHACQLVPVEIYTHDTYFGRHRGYFMAPDFLNAYRFTHELDASATEIMKKLVDGFND